MSDLLLAFYADDFTGATDAMEALTKGGVNTTLVLDASALERMSLPEDIRCVGVAGTTRSLAPAEIGTELSAALPALSSLHPRLIQYKVCSTFDSSPAVGSIGQAIDTAMACFGRIPVPLVVGVPALGRYCVFGNLFAVAGSGAPDTYRLDRHPVMSRHPLTPMKEADLRRVLAEQTIVPVTLHPVTSRNLSFADPKAAGSVVLCDVLDEAGLADLGEAIWAGVIAGSVRFAVGSSGLDYALVAEWRRRCLTANEPPGPTGPAPADQVLVVSASCSAVTVEQLHYAVASGFVGIGIDGYRLATQPDSEITRLTNAARLALSKGLSVALHTFPGTTADADPVSDFLPSSELGAYLAACINDLLPDLSSRRIIVCGGDTSSYVGRALEIERLDFIRSIDPGAPLCRATRRTSPESFEVAFKGGQMGRPDYLIRAMGLSRSRTRRPGLSTRTWPGRVPALSSGSAPVRLVVVRA